jgi:predicted nucleotidyltransferase
MDKNYIITQVRQALRHLNVNKAILFGSYSTGNQNERSDIDLYVVTNDDFIPQSFAQKMEIKLKIAQALEALRTDSDIDLIVHTKPMFEEFIRQNSSFKKQILNTGTTIYETNN